MFATRRNKFLVAFALLLLLTVAVLLAGAHVNRPRWWWIAAVEPSADGRTLTAELMFSRPKADGTFCEQVTGTVVKETASQVAVGVRIYNECAPLFSWGTVRTSAAGHPFDVDLRLRAPLAGRTVVEESSGQRVPIPGPSGRYMTQETP